MSESTDKIKHVLLIVGGETPEVVTETLWGLWYHVREGRGPGEGAADITGGEIVLVTTSAGKDYMLHPKYRGALKADDRMLGDKHDRNGIITRFNEEYQLPGRGWTFSDNSIHVLVDARGNSLRDLRISEDNRQAANQILKLVRKYTTDPNVRLHASIAGGRRTLGIYLAQAMSWYARPHDTLSHVLADAEFDEPFPRIHQSKMQKYVRLEDKIVDKDKVHFIQFPFPLFRRIFENENSSKVADLGKYLYAEEENFDHTKIVLLSKILAVVFGPRYPQETGITVSLNEPSHEDETPKCSRSDSYIFRLTFDSKKMAKKIGEKNEIEIDSLLRHLSTVIKVRLTRVQAGLYLFLQRCANDSKRKACKNLSKNGGFEFGCPVESYRAVEHLHDCIEAMTIAEERRSTQGFSSLAGDKDCWAPEWKSPPTSNPSLDKKRADNLIKAISEIKMEFQDVLGLIAEDCWFTPRFYGKQKERKVHLDIPNVFFSCDASDNCPSESVLGISINGQQTGSSDLPTAEEQQESVGLENVLLLTGGGHPDVLWETLCGLKDHNIRSGKIHILTTRHCFNGFQNATRSLKDFCRDARIQWRVVEDNASVKGGIQILRHMDAGGRRKYVIKDLLSKEDNEAAADDIFRAIQHWTAKQNVRLHVCIAGGRKTMAVYASQILSWLGRREDTLSHVVERDAMADQAGNTPCANTRDVHPSDPRQFADCREIPFMMLDYVRYAPYRVAFLPGKFEGTGWRGFVETANLSIWHWRWLRDDASISSPALMEIPASKEKVTKALCLRVPENLNIAVWRPRSNSRLGLRAYAFLCLKHNIAKRQEKLRIPQNSDAWNDSDKRALEAIEKGLSEQSVEFIRTNVLKKAQKDLESSVGALSYTEGKDPKGKDLRIRYENDEFWVDLADIQIEEGIIDL